MTDISMLKSKINREKGFTLIELLIAMALALVIIGALSGAFVSQRKTYAVQEQVSEMIQNARAAMDMISREIKMAGYAPTGYDKTFEGGGTQTTPPPSLMQRKDPTASRFVGIPYDTTQLEIIADLTGDGLTDDDNEKITYKYYDETAYPKQIKRKTSDAGTFQPLAENIQGFSFSYWDPNGAEITSSVGQANIRMIKIEIEARTAQEDSNYTHPINGDGYRTYTLTSFVTPPNLGF